MNYITSKKKKSYAHLVTDTSFFYKFLNLYCEKKFGLYWRQLPVAK